MSFTGSTFSNTGKTKFLKIQQLRQPGNRLLKYAASALRPTNFVLYFSPFLNKHFDLRDNFGILFTLQVQTLQIKLFSGTEGLREGTEESETTEQQSFQGTKCFY